MDPNSGDIIVSRQVEALTTYIVNISAQDEGGLSTITQIILRINDTNNNRWRSPGTNARRWSSPTFPLMISP